MFKLFSDGFELLVDDKLYGEVKPQFRISNIPHTEVWERGTAITPFDQLVRINLLKLIKTWKLSKKKKNTESITAGSIVNDLCIGFPLDLYLRTELNISLRTSSSTYHLECVLVGSTTSLTLLKNLGWTAAPKLCSSFGKTRTFGRKLGLHRS